MGPFPLIFSYLPAFGLGDYLALFACVLTVFAIIVARMPKPASQWVEGMDPADTAAHSVAVLDAIIQHLHAENWPEVARDCARVRGSLAAIREMDEASGGAGRSRLGTAIEHLARLETLAIAQSGANPPPTDAAAWVRLTLDLQEIRGILRERESR